MAAVTLALYGVLQAVDGVALKQAVNAWANAPDAEKAARFATAEAIRWLEWGARSYTNFALGLSLVLFAAAVPRTARFPRTVGFLMGLSGLTYLVQGWVAGTEGFSETQTIAIVLAWVLNLTWMIWLIVAARRMQDSESSLIVDRARVLSGASLRCCQSAMSCASSPRTFDFKSHSEFRRFQSRLLGNNPS